MRRFVMFYDIDNRRSCGTSTKTTLT